MIKSSPFVCTREAIDSFNFPHLPFLCRSGLVVEGKAERKKIKTMAHLRRSVSLVAANVSKCTECFLLPSSSAGSGSSSRRLSTTSRKGIGPPDVVDSSQNFAEILQQVQDGSLSASQATRIIATSLEKQTTTLARKKDDDDDPIRDFANLDLRRASRVGFPEAVFAEGKTAQQVAMILDRMAHAAAAARQSEEDDGNDRLPTPILATRYEFSLDITKSSFRTSSRGSSNKASHTYLTALNFFLQSDGSDVSRDSTICIPEWIHTLL